MSDTYWRMDAAALAAAYAAGDLTPADVMAGCRDRIERLNRRINAFVALSETAMEEARMSAGRWAEGRPLSPLDGVPIAIKDNLVVRGMLATWGCPHYADAIADADELPVARVRAAGLIMVGKTNVPEFTLEGYTGNPIHGVTGNPWAPNLTPGGSSGGSVAAVAAGLVPLALGTDGGGSTRRPAAYTGLVGLKPSIGSIARGGGLPQILLDFEVVGLIARNVGDVEMLYGLLSGRDDRDHRSRMDCIPPAREGPIKVRYVERFGDAPLDPAIAESVSDAATVLAALGCVVDRGDLPFDIEPINRFWPTVGMVGLAGLMDADPTLRDRASPKYVELAERGAQVQSHQFLSGLETVWAFRDRVGLAFRDHDVIMTPTCAAMPWSAGEAYPALIDGHKVGPRGHAVYTGWVNVAGHPAINLPAKPAADGMPIGFQLVADMRSERLLLDIARRYEAARPWADRWPKMALSCATAV